MPDSFPPNSVPPNDLHLSANVSEVIVGAGGGSGGKGGGGGSGSARTPVEAPNTLRSTSYGVIMDIISEGPIKGLANGGQGVLLNDVPLLNVDGSPAFSGVSMVGKEGYPDQSPVVGFAYNNLSDPAFTVPISIQIKNSSPGAITRAVDDHNASSVSVILSIPQLFTVDTKNGDTNPYSIGFQISTRALATQPFTIVVAETISGKTTSNYQRQYRVNRPSGGGTWEIRVTKTTTDSTASTTVDALFWDAMVVMYDNLMSYPNTAYCMTQFDASQFGQSLPSRKFHVYGRLLQIPTNYDPVTRTYYGIWDGTFKLEYSNNPAWVWYDLITNNWFGAGEVIDPSTVDKWSLYSIAQFCDQQVPDGTGSGTEPRFTFNGVLDRPDDGLKVLAQIAAMFDSVVYANASLVTVVQDNNYQPTRLVTQANVVNGEFTYQGTSHSTRPTAIRTLFIDPLEQWHPSVEVVEYPELVTKWGYRSQDLQLVGCTSRGQAARKGLNTIDLSWTSGEVCSFSAGLDMADLMPGEVILVADPLYAGVRMGGRCGIGCTTTGIALDDGVTLSPFQTYVLYVTYPDGEVDARDVASPADGHQYTTLQLASPLRMAPTSEAVWILSSSNLEPRPFRVLTVSEKSNVSLEVVAVFLDETRRDRVDFGIRRKPPRFSDLPALSAILPPPTNLTVAENFTGIGTTTVIRVMLSWTTPNDARIGSFQIEAINQHTGHTDSFTSRVNSFTIDGLPPDLYTFRVRCVSLNGLLVSAWCIHVGSNIDGISDPPQTPRGFTAIGGTRIIQLFWQANPERDINYYEIWRAPNIANAPYSLLAQVFATAYIDGAQDKLLPNSSWWYMLRAVTTTSGISAFCPPVMATTTLLLVDDLADGIINTAKFAKTIKPVTLITSLSVGGVEGALAFNEADGMLYTRHLNAWVPLITFDSITTQQLNDLIAAKWTGTITSTQIQDGSISTPKLAAGAVTTAKLAAGSVITESLAVSSASNVIWNSCLEQGREGWNFASSVGFSAFGSTKDGPYDPTWRVWGYGSGFMGAAGFFNVNQSVMECAFDPNYSDAGNPLGMPFPVNTPIEAQALLITHRCVARVQIDCYDYLNQYISSIYGNRVSNHAAGGSAISQYRLSWAHGITPPGTERVRFVLVAFNDGGGDIAPQTVPPFVFFTQTLVGASMPNAWQPQVWSPGGVTSISGGVIKTQSIFANQLAANSVIFGKVAAGAIRADQIAANEIHSTHLAADFLLAQNSQFGTAVIDTAQIRNLVVTTGKIANSAVNDVFWTFGSPSQQNYYLTVTTDGSPIQFVYSLYAGSYGGYPGRVIIYRNNPTVIPGYFIDRPGAGTYQYQIHFTANPSDPLLSGDPDVFWANNYNSGSVFANILAIVHKK